MKNNPKYILVHCSDYPHSIMFDQSQACEGWHKDRDFPKSSMGYYCGYHQFITGDKNYQRRRPTEVGAHCNQHVDGLSMNYQSLGVCVGGDFDIEQMTPIQIGLLQKQIWDWQDVYRISNENVKFHRDYSPDKTCPGALITRNWLNTLLERPKPVVVPPKPPETMCIAQENEIKELKEQLSWYEQIVNWLFRRV